MNLFEINGFLRDLIESATNPETGEINSQLSSEIEDLTIERDNKVEYLALLKKELEYKSEALHEECEILKARKKIVDKKCEWIRLYLSTILNGQNFETPRVVISWRKSESLQIDNENLLPAEYYRYTESVDKLKIKEALKSGVQIDGCQIVAKNHIQIK